MKHQDILKYLPYSAPFLFVEALETVNEKGAKGTFTFDPALDFYRGHFNGSPVTPGVILVECCAQIGLVCLGIFLNLPSLEKGTGDFGVALSGSEMEFYLPVLPGEQVTVRSEVVYYRFHKLKCKVQMHNGKNELVCKGILSGMVKTK